MSPKKVYLDACCFIEVALDAKGQASPHNGKFVWYVKALLRAAKDGEVEVHTSMISLVECLRINENGPSIPDDVQRLFRGLLSSGNSGVIPHAVDYFIAETARNLRWKHQISLKPADSIHVATALEAKCDEFLTMDGLDGSPRKLLGKKDDLKLIGLRVMTPDQTSCIPDKYKQHVIVNVPAKKRARRRK